MTVQVLYIGGTPNNTHVNAKNKVNALGQETRQQLWKDLQEALLDASITSLVLTGRPPFFSAGADISEFLVDPPDINKEESVVSLVQLCHALEASPKPVVAAINGMALGGGCELALACHYRIILQSANANANTKIQLGLPETQIGLIPGAGGTQRLPRLVGMQQALQMIVTGQSVGPQQALHMGLVDAIVTTMEDVQRWAEWAQLFLPRTRRTCLQSPPYNGGGGGGRKRTELERLEAAVVSPTMIPLLPTASRGGDAVQAAVQALTAAAAATTANNFQEGMEEEARLFTHLLAHSAQGRARRHVFFAERAVHKTRRAITTTTTTNHENAPLLPAKQEMVVGVVGAGTMGSGIAVSFLRAGYGTVRLYDSNPDGLKRGVSLITNILMGDVKKGRQTALRVKHMLEQVLQPDASSSLQCMKDCHVVVEAAFESMPVKQAIFRQLDQIVTSPYALLLSNTSTLSVDEIASVVSPQRRSQVAGMHFFSPAHLMKLVEIVVGSNDHTTSPHTALQVSRLTKSLSKVGVTVGNCEGFVGNRMLFPYTAEMCHIVIDTATSISDVDAAILQLGVALGPFMMSDLAGNDIGYMIRTEKGLVRDKTGQVGPHRTPGMRYTELADDMVVQLGRVGQKALKGWYDYDPAVGKGRKPIPSKEMTQFLAKYRLKTASPHKLSSQEIVERILFPLVNEGFKILEEGIADKPSDIDIIYIYGYGWPAWQGGPMYWADHAVGLPHLLKTLEKLQKRYPGSDYFVPSKLLRTCVSMQCTVQDFYKKHPNGPTSATAQSKL